MAEPSERSGHPSVPRVLYRKKPPSQVNRDKLRSQAWKSKSQTMDIKRTSEQTQIKVSSECQTCDPQPATSTIDNESGAECLTSTVDSDRLVTYIDGSNHLENINKQPKDSDTQSSSLDSDSRESESEIEMYTVHCDGCRSYLSCKAGTKWGTCTDCEDVDLCISCYQSGKHNEHSEQLHQFTAPDGLCIVGSSQIFCDSCGYVFHAQQSKFYDCLNCDNFTLCHLCHSKGMHRKHCRNRN